MLKRMDHVGVVVNDLAEAKRFLEGMGLLLDRDVEIPGRLRAAFYACGGAQRLGDSAARIDHVAFEVDSLTPTVEALRGLGVEMTAAEPLPVAGNLSYWTKAETSDGVQYQLIEKGASEPT